MTQPSLPLYAKPHPCAPSLAAVLSAGATIHGVMRASSRIRRASGFGVAGRAGDVTVSGYGVAGQGRDKQEAQAAWVMGVLL